MKFSFQFQARILVMAVFLISIMQIQGQLFRKSINAYDESGKRKGKWISYWDEEGKVRMSMAKFKNGREVGVGKEYHINGKMRLKFRHSANRIRIKYYDEDRKLEQKGWAVIEYNEEDTHYYWQGKWKFYDSNRKLERISVYEKGEMLSSSE